MKTAVRSIGVALLLCLMLTGIGAMQAAAVVVFSDDMEGNVANNWWRIAVADSAFEQSSEQAHSGTYSLKYPVGTRYTAIHVVGGPQSTGTTNNNGSYRPFNTCKLEGWFYDAGAPTANGCNSVFQLRGVDGGSINQDPSLNTGNTVKWTCSIGQLTASTSTNKGNYWAASRNGATIADTDTTNIKPRSPGWHKYTVEIRATDVVFTVDDASVTLARPSNLDLAANAGCAYIWLGRQSASPLAGYYDDIQFSADAPAAPSNLTGTAQTHTSIRWNWTDNSDDEYGFMLYSQTGTVARIFHNSPAAPSPVTVTEGSLLPNTPYTRSIVSFNGTLDSAPAVSAPVYTHAAPPTATNVTSSHPKQTWIPFGTPLTFTAVGGFGEGTVQYYRYAWDQSPTYTWTETEPIWSSGDLTVNPTSMGSTWYLHVKAYNGDDVGGATYNAGPFWFGMTKAWEFDTGSAVNSSPTVDGSIVYVGNNAGKVFAGSAATGALTEIADVGAAIKSRLALYGGSLYFTAADGKVYSLSTTGTVNWGTSIGGVALKSTPAVWDGFVWVGSDDGRIYKLNAVTGAVEGSLNLASGPISSSPAIPPTPGGGRIVVGTDSGKLFCMSSFFDIFTEVTLDSSVKGSPVAQWLTGDYYVGSTTKLTKLSLSTGNQVWSAATTGEIAVSPWVDTGGTAVYAVSQDGKIYAFDVVTGAVLTDYPVTIADSVFNGAPVKIPGVAGGNYLYAAANTGIYSIDVSLPTSSLGGFAGVFNSSPSVSGVTAGDVLVVGSDDGKVYGFNLR